jgi:hypothetical protein
VARRKDLDWRRKWAREQLEEERDREDIPQPRPSIRRDDWRDVPADSPPWPRPMCTSTCSSSRPVAGAKTETSAPDGPPTYGRALWGFEHPRCEATRAECPGRPERGVTGSGRCTGFFPPNPSQGSHPLLPLTAEVRSNPGTPIIPMLRLCHDGNARPFLVK